MKNRLFRSFRSLLVKYFRHVRTTAFANCIFHFRKSKNSILPSFSLALHLVVPLSRSLARSQFVALFFLGAWMASWDARPVRQKPGQSRQKEAEMGTAKARERERARPLFVVQCPLGLIKQSLFKCWLSCKAQHSVMKPLKHDSSPLFGHPSVDASLPPACPVWRRGICISISQLHNICSVGLLLFFPLPLARMYLGRI